MILLQIKCVDQFVNDVHSTLRQRQDHELLKGIIARIESYDVVVSCGICLINTLSVFTDYSLIIVLERDSQNSSTNTLPIPNYFMPCWN